ncbi:hypothetical protein LTR64_004605 [Lithohypha guttulata]|uniref:uncharacterized protein n=1 Tax=Lithohypha guttulata TaxID=1690604 RepID=UPI002DDF4C88|nr:hypothetical protein LTR51_006097 [Lithohypha guttulata]
MDEDDERAIELSTIAAIFPELVIDQARPFHATLDVPVAPEKPLKIYFQSSTTSAPLDVLTPPGTDSSGNEGGLKQPAATPLAAVLNVDVHQLSHLPPLKLDISLPDGYPQQRPPDVKVHAQPLWLPQKTITDIQARCAELWKDCGQDQVVYTFIDYVQQEAEKAFGLADNPEHRFELASDLKLILLDHDLKRKREQFENETFECGICLEPKKGKICHRMLLCGHVFCVACLQDFFNNCITEGDVDNVKCLDPGCGKDIVVEVSPGKKRKVDRTLNPSELLQIPIDQELVQRYVRLKRKKKLEADKNTIYCPRQWCQGAAKSKRHPKSDDPLHDGTASDYESEIEEKPTKRKKADPEDIPMSERLAVCEDCNFAFCSVCKKGWHGELARCNPRRQAELNEEEKASLEYMQRFSTPCPTCNAPAQKTYGCNHMICFKCKTHFCYLCSAYLMPDNPYRHFNELKSTCYMRLWELEGGDGADVGIGFAGGAAAPWQAEDLEDDDLDDEEEDLPAENFGAFGGDAPAAWDDDTDDEEPAPDQRRPNRPHIELVNFARNGAPRLIELQPPPRAPPPAPNPPAHQQRGGHRGRGGNAQRRAPAHAVPALAVQPAQLRAHIPGNGNDAAAAPQVRAAPGQGNNAEQGIQRFIRLALEDREDEWDSDED